MFSPKHLFFFLQEHRNYLFTQDDGHCKQIIDHNFLGFLTVFPLLIF